MRKLRILRESAGLSLEALGRKADVLSATISRFETGQHKDMASQRLERIAEALSTALGRTVTLKELAEDIEPEEATA